jgi:hypothetical protein
VSGSDQKLFATIGCKPRMSSEHDSGTSLMSAVAGGHEFTLLPSCVSGVAGPRLKLLKPRSALPPWSRPGDLFAVRAAAGDPGEPGKGIAGSPGADML